SVWLLSPHAVRIGNVVIAPAEVAAPPGALRLTDSAAFGTGHHPTTALCIEAIEEAMTIAVPDSILDVGTGSGILALAALTMGVPQAVGLDIDADALEVAAANARLNNLTDGLQLVLGGPDVVDGAWPLIVANVLAAPLIEMAPILVRRVGNRGRLILSGIPRSLESEVRQTYEHLGMRDVRAEPRGRWTVVVVQAAWEPPCDDAGPRTMATDDRIDVLVIGAGAAGAAVAWRLASAGVRVRCLEQGDW